MANLGEVSRAWRWFFLAAAAYNLIIGLAGMITPGATVDARIVGLLVFAFGVIYYLVSRDPLRFAPTLWAGVIGKAGVVGLLAPEGFVENGDSLIAAILIGDMLFTLGFLVFLLRRDRMAG